MRRLVPLAAAGLALAGLAALPRHLTSRPAVGPDFVHFESPHVHPAALTPDGTRLLVVNTADSRLAVFDITSSTPTRVAEIPVGLEPISVAVRDNGEAWVVNYLSDDVSVVDLNTLHVRATLRVGDEPADVAFAAGRAYVSVSQEDVVKVIDPASLDFVGPPIAVNGRFPMALAPSADGSRVYVAVLQGGNRTSVLSASTVDNEVQDSLPPAQPPRSASLPPNAPRVGLIVQQQASGDWLDESGKLWNSKVPYSMHEVDVAEISTAGNSVVAEHGGLGTVNFNLAAGPAGELAVVSTEARNLIRFEPNLRGNMVRTRLALIEGGGAAVHELNPQVNYADTVGTQAERDSALGIVTGVAWSPTGQRLYVTALASDRLGVLDGSGNLLARHATVAGPTGVVVDEGRHRLYVVGRFRNQLQTLSTLDFSQLALAAIGFDPTPDAIVNGRKFFYGGFTSAHGEQACATCHVFGDRDGIAWDLGDPLGQYQAKPPGMLLGPLLEGFDPMKGPMDTQTLRGLPGTGRLHWRADRADLSEFRPAFRALLGGPTISDTAFSAFSDFVLALAYPPNPRQNLDRTMPDAPPGQPSALRGQNLFMTAALDGGVTCNFCHAVPTGTSGQMINDDALLEDQDMKIPQLRNLYEKTGFTDQPGAVNKRGFGFTHDGAMDNLFNFLKLPVFTFAGGATGDAQRRDVEAFLLAFDTGTAPAVGYQITYTGGNGDDTLALHTLRLRAAASDCELVAKGRRANGQPRGWRYDPATQRWAPDKQAEGEIPSDALLALAGPGTEVTVSAVPFNSGLRMGVDRDRDGYRDGDELDAGTDPGDPASHPGAVAVGDGAAGTRFQGVWPNPSRGRAEAVFTLGRAGRVDLRVYDLLGREVQVLARDLWMQAGPQRLAWEGGQGDGREAPAGVYFMRLRTPSGEWSRPLIRLR